MNWKEIIKSDTCTVETKEHLYDTLKKFGANNELLNSVTDANTEEIVDLLEDLSQTLPNMEQRKIFKAILTNHNNCATKLQGLYGSKTDFSDSFQTKLASEKIKKGIRGKKLDPNMELILERKLTSPKTTRQIADLLSMGLSELNIERRKNNKRTLSTRGIPNYQSLPQMLKKHPNIQVIPGNTAQYIWVN